jgi:hypothetical protein
MSMGLFCVHLKRPFIKWYEKRIDETTKTRDFYAYFYVEHFLSLPRVKALLKDKPVRPEFRKALIYAASNPQEIHDYEELCLHALDICENYDDAEHEIIKFFLITPGGLDQWRVENPNIEKLKEVNGLAIKKEKPIELSMQLTDINKK